MVRYIFIDTINIVDIKEQSNLGLIKIDFVKNSIFYRELVITESFYSTDVVKYRKNGCFIT